MTRYWSDLVSRWGQWAQDLTQPVSEPSWTTPNRIVLECPLAALRRFDDRGRGAPWIVVTPNAGHHSMIGDYAPGQSLIEVVLENGGGAPVYAVEWQPARAATRSAAIDDYLLALDRMIGFARQQAGARRVRLVGLCQGGWLSAMMTAILPDVVENLILAGAPIDFRAGQGKITRAVESLGFPWYEALVRRSGGVMPGRYMVAGWKLMNPLERFVEDPWRLWENLEEEEFVDRHRRFRGWYEWTQDLPGRFYLQVVKELFDENRLVKKTFRALGEVVDLGRIHCPVSTIGGFTDDITLQEQLEAVEDHVSSAVVRKRMVPAGHVGLFIQRQVVREVWPELVREAITDAETYFGRVRTLASGGVPTLEERGVGRECRTGARPDGLLLAAGETPPCADMVEIGTADNRLPLTVAWADAG